MMRGDWKSEALEYRDIDLAAQAEAERALDNQEALDLLRAYVALFHDLSPGDRALARTVKRNDELSQRVYNLLRRIG